VKTLTSRREIRSIIKAQARITQVSSLKHYMPRRLMSFFFQSRTLPEGSEANLCQVFAARTVMTHKYHLQQNDLHEGV
jgi:hypothetical protein